MFFNENGYHTAAMTDLEEEVREELLNKFGGADYPINSPMDLAPALPNGPSTRFEAGDGEFSMSAMELNTKLDGGADDFPYESAESFVDDLVDQLKTEGFI